MDAMQEKKQIVHLLTKFMGKDYVKSNAKIFQQLQTLQKDIDNDFFTVVVLGEFKRGKSTFVNALLGTKLLPMDVLPETATINAIMYSEKPRLSVLYRDGRKVKGEVSYDYMKQFSAGSGSSALKNISYIKIGYPCELLKNRIVLVDTPGVSDLNEQRSEITYRFVPKANAILFLLDANSPLKGTEKDFIEEKLLPLGIENILFLLNKYDSVDDEEEENFLDDVKNRILRAFNITERDATLKNITLYPISAKQALQGIERNNPNLIKMSGLETIINKLRTMLFHGNIEQQKIESYKRRFKIIASLFAQELAGEKTMKSAGIEELEKAVATLNQILSENSLDQKKIDDYTDSAKKRIYAMTDKSVSYFHAKLKENILEKIKQYHSQDFKNFIEQTITREIRKNIESWIGAYAPHINELLVNMERELAKGLSHHFNQKVRLQAATGERLQTILPVMNVEAKDISNTGLHSSAITALGAVGVAAFVTPLLLPVVGFFGRSKIFEELLKSRLADAKTLAIPQIENQLTKITEELSQHVHDYIEQKISIIKKNTLTAYELILTDMQKRIQTQIDEKKSQSVEVRKELYTLTKNEFEVQGLIAKLEDGD